MKKNTNTLLPPLQTTLYFAHVAALNTLLDFVANQAEILSDAMPSDLRDAELVDAVYNLQKLVTDEIARLLYIPGATDKLYLAMTTLHKHDQASMEALKAIVEIAAADNEQREKGKASM